MDTLQRKHATAIECDEKKTVSSFEFRLILIRSLVDLGLMPKENYPAAAMAAKLMRANESALRQHLYEQKTTKAESDLSDKYLKM